MSAKSFQIGNLSIKTPKMCRTLLFCTEDYLKITSIQESDYVIVLIKILYS